MTKAERSVSKQGQLQPRCHSKASSLSGQRLNGQTCVLCIDFGDSERHSRHHRYQGSKEVKAKLKKDKLYLTTNATALHAILSHPSKELRILLAETISHPTLALLG